ncbi:MAG: hypothetical protein R2761_22710 [Acidimicrobiales bacterium]
MMRRFPLAAGAASLLLSLALAACGSDGEPTDAGTDTSGSTSSGSSSDGTAPDGTSSDADGPLGGGIGAIGTIEVEITRPDTDPVRYTIGCLGDTFTVTPEVEGIDGATACVRLGETEVLERLTDGPPPDQACTEIYGGPDVATITGELDGKAIDATIDRTDGCGISDWDDLLAGVLPPAEGVS